VKTLLHYLLFYWRICSDIYLHYHFGIYPYSGSMFGILDRHPSTAADAWKFGISNTCQDDTCRFPFIEKQGQERFAIFPQQALPKHWIRVWIIICGS